MGQAVTVPCCDNERISYIHQTPEECTFRGRDLENPDPELRDPKWECLSPNDHHTYRTRLDLQRGQWSYIVLSHHDAWVDATSSFTDALRSVRTYLNGKRIIEVRKGLAYGILVVREDGLTATIIPTPRHVKFRKVD